MKRQEICKSRLFLQNSWNSLIFYCCKSWVKVKNCRISLILWKTATLFFLLKLYILVRQKKWSDKGGLFHCVSKILPRRIEWHMYLSIKPKRNVFNLLCKEVLMYCVSTCPINDISSIWQRELINVLCSQCFYVKIREKGRFWNMFKKSFDFLSYESSYSWFPPQYYVKEVCKVPTALHAAGRNKLWHHFFLYFN